MISDKTRAETHAESNTYIFSTQEKQQPVVLKN